MIGKNLPVYIPDRQKEGYGPNLPALMKLKDNGASVIITVDCGTTAFEPLEAAAKAGLKIIVIDHHVAEPRLPKGSLVINPNRFDETSKHGQLAAVGVTFLFITALNRALRKLNWYDKTLPEPNLMKFIGLVALGTICDVCDYPMEIVDNSFEQLHDLDQQLTAVLIREGFDDGIPDADNLPNIKDPLAQLGKKLFYTKLLGGDFDTACGSCHHPKLGGGDSLSLPIGVAAEVPDLLGPGRMHSETGFEFDSGPTVSRNSNSIFNIAFWKRALFWDGRIEQVPGGIRTPDTALGRPDSNAGPNLVTAQARFPFLARDEMRGHKSELRLRKEELRAHIASRLHTNLLKSKDDTNWLEEFRIAFNKPQGKLSELITFDNIALAIAEFERSQIFVNTPFASYVQGDKTAISEEAKLGALLFFNTSENGGAGCSSCHSGEFFTDEKFHVLAIPQIGRGKGDDDLFSNMSGAKKTDDFGRFRITGNPEDLYAFRTPTLLNVTATGPWGHSGAYTKLENIVRHHLNPNQALEFYDISQLFQKGLQLEDMMINTQNALEHLDVLRETNLSKLSITYLSEDEISDLLTFLKTLTDPCVQDSVCLEPWIDGDFKFTITSNIEQGVNYD